MRRPSRVAALVMAGLLAGCETPAGTPSSLAPGVTPAAPTAFVEPTLPLPAHSDLRSLGALEIEATPNPDFAVLVDGFLYVGGVGQGIAKLDANGTQVATWSIPGDTCGALDAAFGAVWSATCEGPGLVRIDTATGSLTPIELGGVLPDSESSVGAGEGAVWIVIGDSARALVRVDPATNAVVDRFELPGNALAVRAGEGAVWVSDPVAFVIHRIDPDTGLIEATIEVGAKPQFLTVGAGAVWTMNQVYGSVSRIDPASNTSVALIELGERIDGGDIAVGGGFVWVRGSTTLLFKIDPATNEVVARYSPSAGSGSVAADDAAVWMTAHDTTTIWRLPLP